MKKIDRTEIVAGLPDGCQGALLIIDNGDGKSATCLMQMSKSVCTPNMISQILIAMQRTLSESNEKLLMQLVTEVHSEMD